MKKISVIIFILSVFACESQTDSNSVSIYRHILSHKVHKNKDGTQILFDKNFVSTLGGAVDTVWQHIEPNPGKQDAISTSLFAASDGSFYLASMKDGGFLTKISTTGQVEWTLDRNFSEDTDKYSTLFGGIFERSNGDIIAYGSEGQIVPGIGFFTDAVPNRLIISPDGVVKEEKSARNTFTAFYGNYGPIKQYQPFSDTRVYLEHKSDSIILYSMDTSLSVIDSKIGIANEYYKGPFIGYGGVIGYDSNSFIFSYQGIKPKPDSLFSMIFLRFSKKFELLNRLIVYTKAIGDVAIYNDGGYLIMTRGTNYRTHLTKLDRNGVVLWDREPNILKDIPLYNFKLTKSSKSGFIITGEMYQKSSNGSFNTNKEPHTGFIGKLNDEGECEWYYTTGRENYWNIIQNFAEANNGDIITVCNSINTSETFEKETPMVIVRLRPRATSVSEQPEQPDGITISPNPASTSFTISGIEGVTSVKILTMLGMEVKQLSMVNVQLSIDVSDLASGVYFVQFRTLAGVVSKPIVVSR